MGQQGNDRLSALDNSFLLLESRTTYMHIAVTGIFEPGSVVSEGGGIDIERIRSYVAARLHLVPRYRQRLAYVPLVREPVWVDDDQLDLGYHVRHSSLPRPGSDEQLRQLCARILERQLDRRRPLWEIWLIEGLAEGRFAMLAKVHHCMVDGLGGVELLAALLGFTPATEVGAAPPWVPRRTPADVSLLRREAGRRIRSSVDAIRGARSVLGRPDRIAAELGRGASGIARLARSSTRGAGGRLPFNAPIGPHRRVQWFEQDLDRIKEVKARLGGTINDVVLTTVTGAVGRFLERRGRRVDDLVMRAAVPVSTRAAATAGNGGNSVAAWIVPLALRADDPLRRFAAVRDATADLKRTHQAEAAEALTRATEWTGTNLLGVALRVLGRARPYDVVVTNVPGPADSLYLLDARMIAAYPHLPLFEGQGLGIALFSYANKIYWGLKGEWELMPDLDDLSSMMAEAFAELYERSCDAAANGRVDGAHDDGIAPSQGTSTLPPEAATIAPPPNGPEPERSVSLDRIRAERRDGRAGGLSTRA